MNTMELMFQSGCCDINWEFGIAIFGRGGKERAKLTFSTNTEGWERKQMLVPMFISMGEHLQFGCLYKSTPNWQDIDDSYKL